MINKDIIAVESVFTGIVTKGTNEISQSGSLNGKDVKAVESVFAPRELMEVFKKCGLSFCFSKNGIEEEIGKTKNKGQTCEINGNVVSSPSFHNCFTAFMKKSKNDANTKNCIKQGLRGNVGAAGGTNGSGSHSGAF